MSLLFLLFTAAFATPFEAVLTRPVPWEMDPDEVEELMERAAGMSPPDATEVRVLAEGPDGVLRPVGDYLPPVAPVPIKEGEEQASAQALPSSSTGPADHPGEHSGSLSGKAVYVSQCHGWIWYDSLGHFSTQRGNVYDTVEDFHNPEAANQYLVAYLENAGAKVFTVKDRGMNTDMAVIDNDRPTSQGSYTESGSGFEDGHAGWGHQASWAYGEDPFDTGTTRRFPADGGAVASWVPDVPEDGWYTVYVSWDSDSENATDAHYRITHGGGVIDRSYDQTVHGSTWQYVETLWLYAGTESLEIELIGDSSQSGRYLSADAVRVGGGMGDITRHGGTTGRPRWEEGGILNTQYQGAPTSVYDPYSDGDGSDPSSRSRWAAWERPSGEDAVYLSWHTNAAGTTDQAQGTSTYVYSGSSGSAVAGSEDLAELLQDEMVTAFDLWWESDWSDRGVRSADFGELNPSNNDEMPAALIEAAFHDHYIDVEYIKHPAWRRDASRAMYRGITRYFAERDGLEPTFLPEAPVDLAIIHDAAGELELSWAAGPHGEPYGDAASSYLVQTSSDGRSWDNGTEVQGGSTVLGTRAGNTVYVRVSAVNAGGVSFPSEVVGARRSPDGQAPVLVVSAFDRLEVSNLIWENAGSSLGEVVRMYLHRINAYDTAVAHGEAVADAGWYFDTIADERLGDVDLEAYALVMWVAGEESTADETFTSSQQDRIRSFVEGGGALWASGSEILWDLDNRGDDDDQAFASEVLGASMASDDADSWEVDGEGPLAGLVLDFGEEHGAPYPAEYPDVLEGDGQVIASYPGVGTAALLGEAVALFGFPFECIGDPIARAEVASILLPLLVPDYEAPEPEDTDTPDDSADTAAGDLGPFPDGLGRERLEGGCGCTGGRSASSLLGLLALLGLALSRREEGAGLS